MQGIFFPKGYPHTVTPNYWHFTRWNFISSIAGTVSGGAHTAY